MSDPIVSIKEKGKKWVKDNIKQVVRTQYGSLKHLLWGPITSEQSVCIKFGHFGEFIAKELIKTNPNLELLTCGVQVICKPENAKSDIDILYRNSEEKKLYYYELKGNIDLDTEKKPATIVKCKKIKKHLSKTYKDYNITFGILNWGVYSKTRLNMLKESENKEEKANAKKLLKKIDTYTESEDLVVHHMDDFLINVNVTWPEDNFIEYFREIGTELNRIE